MSDNVNKAINDDNSQQTAEQTRRDFLEKFGKLAAITPVAVTTLMSPKTSAAPKSGCNKHGRGCK